jgi:DNA-directed RNA polymerase subunit M/transcription elongation factor TFIIS
MADPQFAVAEDSQANNTAFDHSSSTAPKLISHDTSLSQSHDKYEPPPPGCWTLDFHGNCPRCHHHHKALQVQIKVTPDASQVSYVHCERCQDRWAAFGGRNSTRISLLSTATIEPDSVERGVRYSLVEVVKLVQARSVLGTLPEASSPVLPHQPSVSAHINVSLSAATQSLDLPTTALNAKDAISAEPGPGRHSFEPIVLQATKHTIAPKGPNSTLRLLSKLKMKITTHFPMLNKGPGRRILGSHSQPEMFMRQFEKSPSRESPTADPTHALAEHSQSSGQYEDAPTGDFQADIVEPSKRIVEVVAFVASLDKTALSSMSEQERSEWMRRKYTSFKARRRRSLSPLGMSTIVETSIQSDVPRHLSSQRSIELLGVGDHVEGLDMLGSIEAALRRGSLTISEISEPWSTLDDINLFGSRRNSGQSHLQRLRHGLGRPQSLPPPLHPYLHLRPDMRNSYDTFVLSERESTASNRGQRQSRFSQGTTIWSSASTVRPISQGTMLRPESRDGQNMESQGSIPSPLFTPQAPPDSLRQA